MATATYMSARKLAENMSYTPRHINEYLKDRVFLEGIHYVRLPGSRRILYIWEAINSEFLDKGAAPIPMASGGVCRG